MPSGPRVPDRGCCGESLRFARPLAPPWQAVGRKAARETAAIAPRRPRVATASPDRWTRNFCAVNFGCAGHALAQQSHARVRKLDNVALFQLAQFQHAASAGDCANDRARPGARRPNTLPGAHPGWRQPFLHMAQTSRKKDALKADCGRWSGTTAS